MLADKLVSLVATKKNITKPVAAKFIDKCLMKISAAENIDYNELYEIFYTFSGLAQCLATECSKATLKECKKSCNCVVFKNECKPRYLPDAAEINHDPDKWAMGLKINELTELVEYASYLYYNYDGGGLTDNSFDALEYHLKKRLKVKGQYWEKIGAEPVDKIKAKLPYPMGSLEKVKPGESGLLPFLSLAEKYGMVWSDKLDGVSGMVIFRNGKVDKIYTRGNGEVGGDITYLKDYLKFPKPTHKYLVVRGEFMIAKQVWESKYKKISANPRSFVSGKINSGFISPAFVDMEFIAYQIVDWSNKKHPAPSQTYKILVEQGFNVPINGVFPKGKPVLVFDLITLYKEQIAASAYAIDGIVLSIDIPQTAEQLMNPKFAKAFKMTLQEKLRDTKVLNVEWNISRYGRYVPVAVYESVYIDGVRLHRANAHNAAHIQDWNMGKGTKIVVTRSGDVIPAIKDVTVDESIEPIYPDTTYKWHWEKKDIVLDDIENNPDVHKRRNTHFFTTIQVPRLGEGRINKLYDEGFKTIKSIVDAKESDFIGIKGFGKKTANTIYTNIHETMRKTRMDRYFEAFTKYRNSISRKTLKKILRSYPQLFTASQKQIIAYLSNPKNKIPGIGKAKIAGIAKTIPEFRKFLIKLNKKDIEYAYKHNEKRLAELEKKGYNPKIKNGLFVMTGFLGVPNYDLEDYIWDNWGDITTTVTSNTTAVITATVGNVTEKMIKAHLLGVPVYTVEEFVKTFNVPIAVKKIPGDTIEELI